MLCNGAPTGGAAGQDSRWICCSSIAGFTGGTASTMWCRFSGAFMRFTTLMKRWIQRPPFASISEKSFCLHWYGLQSYLRLLCRCPLSSCLRSLSWWRPLFQHSNLRIPRVLEKALSLIVVTPSIHWVHHHAVRADTDSNYANILSVWDRLFGSRSSTLRTPDMKIGVEHRPERTLFGLIRRPLDP